MSLDTWILLDISAVALHSLHAGKDSDQILLPSGRKVNTPMHAVMTFTDMYLKPMLNNYPAARIIGAKDCGKEYRLSFFPEYKGGRESEPELREIMAESVKAISDLLINVGVAVCELKGQEADDVLAYLNNSLPGIKLIYTLDKDLLALSGENTLVFLKNELHEQLVEKDAYVDPQHITLYKSLVGDSSDNYNGVYGFGVAAWNQIKTKYHDTGELTFEELIEIAENFENLSSLHPLADVAKNAGRAEMRKLKQLAETDKLLAKILDAHAVVKEVETFNNGQAGKKEDRSWGEWVVSYKLAKLNPGLVGWNQLQWYKRVPSEAAVREILTSIKGGFDSFSQEFKFLYPSQTLVKSAHVSDTSIARLAEAFKSSRIIGLDWETWAEPNANFTKAARGDYVDMFGSKIAGMGITYGKNLEKTLYFQFDHSDEENNIEKARLLEILEIIPEEIPLVIQNMYFEESVLRSDLGVSFANPIYDTKVMHCHIDEMESSGLKDLSKRYLNYTQQRYADVVAKGTTMKDYSGQHVFQYGADDPLVTAHLFDLFYIILNLEGTWEFVRDYEFPTVSLLSSSFCSGVSIDWEEVEKQSVADQKVFDTNLAKVRELIKDNEDLAELTRHAENWYKEEIAPLHALQVKEVQKSLQGATISLQQFEAIPELAAIDSRRKLGLFDETPNPTPAEVMTFYTEQVEAIKRTTIAGMAQEFAYEDFVESTQQESFTFQGTGKLNLLVQSVGLSIEAQTKEPLLDFVARLTTLAKSPEQRNLVEDLLAYATSKDKEAYASLKARYAELGITKAISSGKEFNLNSPKQMQELLYGMIGLPIRVRNFKNSKTRALAGHKLGEPQTNEDAIQEAISWRDVTGWKAEALSCLLTARKADTRIKFFYSKLPLWKHPKDGLIHPQFNSVGTETRRPTGSAPNLLQLGKKGEGANVRACFLPNQKLGHNLVCSSDFDGQELRTIAGLSRDEELMACYVGDDLKDVHSIVAAQIAGMTYEAFIAIKDGSEGADRAKEFVDIRKSAKSVVFGGNYGIGAAKLSRQLHITEDEAREFLNAKKAAYWGMEDWKEKVKADLRRDGYVATLYGSRKHVFSRMKNPDLAAYYERSTVNYLVQGVCADYLKVVLATLWKQRTFQRYNAVLIAPLYDELVWTCHDSVAIPLFKEIHEVMTRGLPNFPVRMLANPAVGVNFKEQKDILKDCNQELTDELIQAAINKVLV